MAEPSDLTFHLLPEPPSKKVLQVFQKDAGTDQIIRRQSRSVLPNAKDQWIAIRCSKALIGIARLELAPPKFCHMSNFILLNTHRRKGIGRWSMKRIEEYCFSLGIQYIVLEPTEQSLPFYTALSFVPDPLVKGALRKNVGIFMKQRFLP